MHQKSSAYLLSLALALPCVAQSQTPSHPVVQWGLSAGVNQYKEPNLMELQGPEVGLHARAYNFNAMPQLHLEGDVFFGKQRYTSNNTGSMNGVHNIETRWRALMPVFANTANQHGLYAGLGLHTLWNDLRGTSSTGSGGYERSATQLWLPVRWVSNFWELEAGVLVYGRHTSKLSEASSRYADIVNTQHHGQYAQASLNFPLSNGDAIKPFVRYTHLADSNTVAMGGSNWLEPASQRWQAGVVWQFIAY